MNKQQQDASATVLEPLLKTVNQIAQFYATLPNPEEANKKMVKHLIAFWEPRMFTPLLDYLEQHSTGKDKYGALSPFAAKALKTYQDTCLNSEKK
ncbi:formate dehydrogenase subunit delta [Advenella sp. RU8]|uniref:formate dehydrogenase subunit delta n=1 Tax=Advenella sp. RU8 TaxID=3399575 RepID=UPI003AAE41A0